MQRYSNTNNERTKTTSGSAEVVGPTLRTDFQVYSKGAMAIPMTTVEVHLETLYPSRKLTAKAIAKSPTFLPGFGGELVSPLIFITKHVGYRKKGESAWAKSKLLRQFSSYGF